MCDSYLMLAIGASQLFGENLPIFPQSFVFCFISINWIPWSYLGLKVFHKSELYRIPVLCSVFILLVLGIVVGIYFDVMKMRQYCIMSVSLEAL